MTDPRRRPGASMEAMTNNQLADAARQVAEQHPPRTAERRAAAALWAALRDTKTPTAARTALGTFTDQQTAADATALLRKLQEPGKPGAPNPRPRRPADEQHA